MNGGKHAVGLVALAALSTTLYACSVGDGSRTFESDGVSFRHPESWDVAGFSTTNSPRRVAVASYPLPDDAVEGDCGGQDAAKRLTSDGALVLVIDYGTTKAAFPARHESLALDQGELAEYECLGRSTMFRFRVGGRDFQVHVALGEKAGDEIRDRALAIVESLEVRA